MIEISTYFKNAKAEFKNLIESRKNADTKDEKSVQEFIENNPFILTSALNGVNANYAFLSRLILSQPNLKSLDGDRKPDFLIVSRDSLNLYFNFIEIEDPSKRFFKKDSTQLTSDFTQAYHQLREWNSYANDEVKKYCKKLLETLFRDNFNNNPDKNLHFNFVLVYGFSDEIQELGGRHNNILGNYFNESNLFHCTYSRMLQNFKTELLPFFSVKKKASTNQFKAIGLTPIGDYQINEWSEFHNIKEKEQVIKSSSFFTDMEKDDLISKIKEFDSKNKREIYKLMDLDEGLDVTSFDELL